MYCKSSVPLDILVHILIPTSVRHIQPVNSVVMTIIGINVVVVLPCFIVFIIISMVHTNFIKIYYWSIDTYYIVEKNGTRCIVSVMYEKVITNK